MKAGSMSREITEARIWKDPLASPDQMIQIPLKHRKQQWIRMSIAKSSMGPSFDLNRNKFVKENQENSIFHDLEMAQSTVFDMDLMSHVYLNILSHHYS